MDESQSGSRIAVSRNVPSATPRYRVWVGKFELGGPLLVHALPCGACHGVMLLRLCLSEADSVNEESPTSALCHWLFKRSATKVCSASPGHELEMTSGKDGVPLPSRESDDADAVDTVASSCPLPPGWWAASPCPESWSPCPESSSPFPMAGPP